MGEKVIKVRCVGGPLDGAVLPKPLSPDVRRLNVPILYQTEAGPHQASYRLLETANGVIWLSNDDWPEGEQ